MSLLFRRSGGAEKRSLSYTDVWGSGGDVNIEGGPGIVSGGLSLVPVYAATSLIADLVSTAPLTAYRRGADNTRRPLPTQPGLVANPSVYGRRVDWLHQAVASLLLRGNAYGYVVSLDSAGIPNKIQWFNPDDVSVVEEQTDWFHWPTYYWRGHPLDRSLVVHIPAYTIGGSYVGYSPLALFKMQIETGLRAQKYGDEWFKHGANPSGMLKNTNRELPPEVADEAKRRFKASTSNHDVFVAGSDWDYKALAVKADEAQFLQTIKANATQIAAIYRVSPEDIGGETGASMTYKTLEQDNAKLTIRTIAVWCARIQEALDQLMPRNWYSKFDLDFVARGDATSRMMAHAAALEAGVETLTEARAAEDKPPLTDEEIKQWQEWYGASAKAISKKVDSVVGAEGLKGGGTA